MKDLKNFGFGLLRLPHIDPNDITDIDLDEMIKMVDKFMESGFMYFDTAYSYLGYKSEAFFKKAVADRYPRESYSITTKLPCLELKDTDNAHNYPFHTCSWVVENLNGTLLGYLLNTLDKLFSL